MTEPFNFEDGLFRCDNCAGLFEQDEARGLRLITKKGLVPMKVCPSCHRKLRWQDWFNQYFLLVIGLVIFLIFIGILFLYAIR